MKNRRRKLKVLVIFLALFVVWLFLAPFLAERLIVEKPLPRADAILILGGSHTYLERTEKAAEIYRQGIAPKIYLTDDGEKSGWSVKEQRNPPFVELARDALVKQGVPAENIEIWRPTVSGTIDEARLLSEKARSLNLSSILLVTSAYHTRRAFSIFQKVFSEQNPTIELGITSPPTGLQTPAPAVWWLSIFGWKIVAGEYVKSVVYSVYY